jgi:hypothetical protein
MDGQRYIGVSPGLLMSSDTNRNAIARFNSVMFYCLWSCAPILVSITSFFVYVSLGNVLDISTAFTVSPFLPVMWRVVMALCTYGNT